MLVRHVVLAAAIACVPSFASAQGHRAGGAFVAARVGANLVGNTYRVRQAKAVAGFGASGGLFLSRFWAAELEVWSRSNNPDSHVGPERLYSLSAQRLYSRIGVQPYLSGGFALLRSQRATHLQVQVTAGVRLPLASRLALDVDLRGNGGGSTMIVRPTMAAVYFFQ